MKPGKSGKPTCYDKFSVAKLTYDDNGNIENIAIKNDSKGVIAFVYQKGK